MADSSGTDELVDTQDEKSKTLIEKIHWFITSPRVDIATARGIVGGILVAVLVSSLLFLYAGVWPPFTTVTSSSMEPNINQNDLVILNNPDTPKSDGGVGDTGVVTYENGEETGYSMFGKSGDVIVFNANGDGDAIIHRAHFYVEEGEDWYERANPSYLNGEQNCDQLRNCPAPNDGFITMGDNNPIYDQVGPDPITKPVHPDWVQSEGQNNWAHLGNLRTVALVLFFSGLFLIARDLLD